MELTIFIFSLLILTSITICILSLNLIHSVFWLTSAFISSAFLLFNFDIYSIAVILLIIYVGAIAILFVFSVMMIDLITLEKKIFLPQITFLLLIITLFFYLNSEILINYKEFDSLTNNTNNFYIIGEFFFNLFNFSVIGSAIILLIPMIGALIFII